jgi:site-specific DNA-cytosine methylase
MYKFVACQSFAGGFDLGVVQAGFELVHKVEQQGGFGMANCEANRHLLGSHWTSQAGDYHEWYAPPDVDFIAANPPCSGFSAMTDKKHRGIDARVNACMWVLMAYAARVKPAIIVMESVRAAYSTGRTMMTALRDKLEELSGLSYNLHHVFQDALELGGAARRPRYFWVASRVPFGVTYPTVRQPLLHEIWDDLRGHALTWEHQPYRRPATWWVDRENARRSTTFDGHALHNSLPNQRAMDLLNLANRDGGWPAGWHIGQVAQHCYEQFGRLPRSWSHLEDRLKNNGFHLGFTSLIRWNPERPARVITGSALDLVLHPFEDRTITHREAARVMGFPDNWSIMPLRHQSNLRLTWGKGITVQCGRWIGEQVRNALDGQPGELIGRPDGDREWFVRNHVKSRILVG